jgi:hypothetical protein
VTLAIYAEETGGTPLWQETQDVAVDADGRYTVLLGATLTDGLPLDLFASGDARWLGRRFERPGEEEQARVRLASVPYALKASDADTLGGRPPSAYLLAEPGAGAGATSAGAPDRAPASFGSVVGPLTAGTAGFVGKFVTPVDLGNSAIYDAGGLVGVNTTTPFDAMHVRFTNTGGQLTGLAVQNLGSTATSYSGMLFYDQNGALGQFQGFNNSTHEYRINNIATSGSINFMIGSSSKFLVANSGNVGVGQPTPSYKLDILHGGATGIHVASSGSFSVVDIDAFSGDAALRFMNAGVNSWNVRNNPANNDLQFFEMGGGGERMAIQDGTGFVGIGGVVPLDRLHVAGDIRVGTGTTGCVRDADGSVIAGTCSSDRRFKKDVTPFGSMLDRVARLTPVNFYWRSAEFADRHFGPAQSFGLIAQDVQKEFPDLVQVDAQGYLAVNYSKLPLLTIQAVKELKAENDTLKAHNADLEARLSALEAAVSAMSRR